MTGATLNNGPGYKKAPDHTITLEPTNETVTVRLNGTVLTKSTAAIRLNESNYDPVLYFPPQDVDTRLITKSEHTSYCPFKGDATYWSCDGLDNIAWSYEAPFDEVMGIKKYVAFYPDKVRIDSA